MTRVHVIGAAGYAAAEAIRYLDAHPYFELGVLESRSLAGERLGDHFPLLRSTPYRCADEGSVVRALRAGDAVIVAGNEEESRAVIPPLLREDVRVVDLSPAYRASAEAVYGLSEWRRTEISEARLVANPGCYPTASLLALLPLASLVEGSSFDCAQSFDSAPFGRCAQDDKALGARAQDDKALGARAQDDKGVRGAPHVMTNIVIDAKSGITGAGRTPKTGSLFAEVSGEIRAYGLGGHRHLPEIERGLQRAGIATSVVFTPQVVPIARGMLACAYATFDKSIGADMVQRAYRDAYRDSAFVRILEGNGVPSVAGVAGTNDAELRVDAIGSTVRVLCAIDNLGKGAAGQAVQNLNIMFGHPETSGLYDRAILA